jgi:hypothetical protein
LPERILEDHSSIVRPCACCRIFVDPVTEQQYPQARFSKTRVASRSCVLCKFLVQVAERFHNDGNVDPSIIRDGATLRLGYEGPRMLRLCSDVG